MIKAGANSSPFGAPMVQARAQVALRQRLWTTTEATEATKTIAAGSRETDFQARPAAVLVTLVKRQPELTVLLTRRAKALRDHPGQIAFPGGKLGPDDAGPLSAALREAHEEIGLERRFVTILGFLGSCRTRTGFLIMPVVALADEGFRLRPQTGEIDAIFEIPLRFLMTPSHYRRMTFAAGGQKTDSYAISHGDCYIWGATARILRDLYERMYGGDAEYAKG